MSSTDRLTRPGAEDLPSAREPSRAAPSGEAAPSSRPLWAGLAASLGAFACCGAALVLATLGVGGGLAAGLKSLAPFRPFFILLTLAAFAWAWWRLYRRAPACAPGEACPPALRRQRRLFWVMAAIAALLVSFPWYGPALLK